MLVRTTDSRVSACARAVLSHGVFQDYPDNIEHKQSARPEQRVPL